MEEEKLIRKKKKALIQGNKQNLAEACNKLATFYYKHSRYNDALEEYKHEANLYKQLGLKMQWGTSNRMVGEMYMLLAEFEKALKYEERHLTVAKELNDLVEEQRAMATLGRIHLLQGQSCCAEEEAKSSLSAAEKAFIKSLELCEKLNGKINKHELMDMRARLLLNIGVVQEHLGGLDKALVCIGKAISICLSGDLHEVLHQCYTTQAFMFSEKGNDYAKALHCLNKALEVASRLEDKTTKTCQTLLAKSEILCKMSDYHSSKQLLHKAWKMQTPDEEEQAIIEKNLRIAAAMCYIQDSLVTTDPSDHKALKKCYEKLGDGACHFKNYTDAVEYYLKMLDQAELAGECGKELVPIYVSLYQTYKDMGSYNDALYYYEKEYDIIKENHKEAFATLYNIAEVLFLARKPYDKLEKVCLEAKNAARELNNKKYEIRILVNLLKYQEEYMETDKIAQTKRELKELGYEEGMDTNDDEQSSPEEEDTTHIGDDICLEDLTDLSDDNEENVAEVKREVRRRGKAFKIKKNAKGETQLHLDSISGNKLMLERRLSEGHPVNIRDNAGWLPLHEACNNGHLEIAEILISHGAHINDRGGTDCGGITPLHDAARNGHLEIVDLLLRKGAITTLKTDTGETVLDCLKKWRSENILNKNEEIMYKSICNKLQEPINRLSISETIIESPPSTSKQQKTSKSPPLRKRNLVIDESDNEDDISISGCKSRTAFPSDDDSIPSDDDRQKKSAKCSTIKEYKDAILALRYRSNNDQQTADVKQNKPKPALLDPTEIDQDDWLDDDLRNSVKSKKRKISDPLDRVTKKPSYNYIKDTIESINEINKPLFNDQNKVDDNAIQISDYSSDLEYHENENLNPKIAAMYETINPNDFNQIKYIKDSRAKMRKRCKKQSSLLRAGFQRRISEDKSSNSGGSDTEQIKENIYTVKRTSSRDNLNGPYGVIKNVNNRTVQPVNMIQPVNIMQHSKNGKSIKTQIMPLTAVKVQIEDKTLLISLKLESINKHNISWLVEEVKSRYYKLTGIRPVFSLMTSDGAILSEDDPLSLVLTSHELKTCITNWKASPAEERYLECCEALGLATSEEIQQAIGRSHTTHRLALGVKTLSSLQIRPLFRALTHQTHLTAIMISNNNLGDAGLKHLTDCLCTLKQLNHLDLSKNNITSQGIEELAKAFERSMRPILQSLEHFDVSDNPIQDEGFKSILKITKHVKLKVLKLNRCGITESANAFEKFGVNFDCLESFDISNNPIKHVMLKCVVAKLNSNVIIELELGNVEVEGSVVGCLAAFMDSARDLKLRRLCLSDCKLVDGQFMRIYRSLGRVKNLQSISLKNNSLTFITLKKLLQRQPPVPTIDLEGCQDIFKFSPDSDFHVWLPAIDFGRCVPEIDVTPIFKSDAERESFRSFSKTWLSCFKGRGIIEHCERSVIKFTAK